MKIQLKLKAHKNKTEFTYDVITVLNNSGKRVWEITVQEKIVYDVMIIGKV